VSRPITAARRSVAGLLLVGAVACGIPSDDRVTLAKPGDVPFDLLAPPAPTNTTVTAPAGG